MINEADYGWNQYVPRRITLDELLGSGAFALIRDTELRVKLSDYHEIYRASQPRIDERETDYPNITYQLVPRSSEFELATDLSQSQVDQIVNAVFASTLREHITSEINLARFIRSQFEIQRKDAVELVSELETYLRGVE